MEDNHLATSAPLVMPVISLAEALVVNPNQALVEATEVSSNSSSSSDHALPPSPLWTVKELASYLNVKPGTVYKMVERGEIPVVRLGRNGRTLRFRRAHVEAWLTELGVDGRSQLAHLDRLDHVDRADHEDS